ncbi:MAG: M20/M25/M40 family metallo-hydrolase [Nitriliruptoraceae bacterium]
MTTPSLPENCSVPAGLDDIAATLISQHNDTREWLNDLVQIPSISAQPEHASDLVASADATADLLRKAGIPSVEVVAVDGSPPYVIGVWEVDPSAPTVLLYAHHDVQPTATAHRWTSPPFEPTERQGRLFARGAADDKAGVLAHVAAIRAWTTARGAPPLNVKVIIEGEEEIGSPHLDAFLAAHAETLRANTIVLTDLVNWQVGWPAITRSLRGQMAMTVTVRSLAQPVHSGIWGGVVPDALTGMARLLASLHDDAGSIAVDGFTDDVAPLTAQDRATLATLAYDADDVRRDTRMLDGVQTVGSNAAGVLERLWWQPTITPTGMDVPKVAEASNTLLSEVSAKITCRLAPGQDPARAVEVLTGHLTRHVPWGLHLDIEVTERNPAWTSAADEAVTDAATTSMAAAYGRPPAIIGCGGSIPFVGPLSAAFGDVPCLLVGVQDPATNAHGEDESLHLDDFTRTCLAQAFLLAALAQPRQH